MEDENDNDNYNQDYKVPDQSEFQLKVGIYLK